VRLKAKVTIDSLLEVVYEESVGRPTKMNDLDLCLEVESRSCQPLRCIQRSLSRKPLEIVAWFQRTTNRKWPIGYQVWCEAVRSAILATAWLLIFIFCCFWCATMPLTGVINYVCHFLLVVLWNRGSIFGFIGP